jgi:hypothetical protein
MADNCIVLKNTQFALISSFSCFFVSVTVLKPYLFGFSFL